MGSRSNICHNKNGSGTGCRIWLGVGTFKYSPVHWRFLDKGPHVFQPISLNMFELPHNFESLGIFFAFRHLFHFSKKGKESLKSSLTSGCAAKFVQPGNVTLLAGFKVQLETNLDSDLAANFCFSSHPQSMLWTQLFFGEQPAVLHHCRCCLLAELFTPRCHGFWCRALLGRWWDRCHKNRDIRLSFRSLRSNTQN